MITIFKLFENVEMWNDFFNKINSGVIVKDPPDVNILQNILEYVPSNGEILDISFGDGVYSEYFINKGYDVSGTEISDIAVDTMETKYPDNTWIIHDTEKNFPFNSNKFDLVFARLSIHYFKKESILNILSDIHRMLKPSGTLYVMVKTSDTGNIVTNKISYTEEEWSNMISENFNIVFEKLENRKAYSFERDSSNVFEVIAKS